MNHLYERIAYLRGLADGMEVEDSKNGKLLIAMIDVLDEMADAVNDLNDDLDDMDEYVEALDEDLADLEDDFYDDEDFDDYDEVECPECGELILIDDPTLCDDGCCETVIHCPACNAQIELMDECECCSFDEDDIEDDEEEA